MSVEPYSYDVAIAGGGASGTLTALNLMRLAQVPLRIGLWDAAGRFGQGVAYSTVDLAHRLNVPARGMGAWPEQPTHFLEWIRAAGGAIQEGDFASRNAYGAYLKALLGEAPKSCTVGVTLSLHAEAMGEVALGGTAVKGQFKSGAPWESRFLVLATGNPLPADLAIPDGGVYASPAYRRSPWAPEAVAELEPDGEVLLLGTGLTSVDVVASLREKGHRGPIHTLSRHGYWPQVHAPFTPLSDGWKLSAGLGLREALRAVREKILAHGSPEEKPAWRAVIDALRPHSQTLWRSFSPDDQRRFLRHLRPHWDVHRHRVAPDPGALVERLRSDGTIATHAGRLVALRPEGGRVVVTYQPRGEAATSTLKVDRVINCTGPATLSSGATPPLAGLISNQSAVVDRHRQGLITNESGELLDGAGNGTGRLFTLGPLRRGELWETTAVPEIRSQAEALAKQLLSRLVAS